LISAALNKRNSVFSTAYLPSREYLLFASQQQNIFIDSTENWQKQTLRNRTFILSPNGIQCLTVPVMHNAGKKITVRDIRISYNEPWIRLHKGALITAYNTSPNFEFLKDDLWSFYDRKYDFLIDLNTEILNWLLRKFGSDLQTDLNLPFPQIAFDDFRQLSGASSTLFVKITESELKPYTQVFNYKFPFQDNLSALDILCNTGRLF
jgi:hypothetical protein